jgi:glycolate oxidase FAD binding subunit
VDLTEPLAALADAVARATGPVVAVGARTHFEVGGPAPRSAGEVRAPAGVLGFDPADLTVTVGAGTSVAELDAALADAGQEVPLDPQRPEATVGGLLATGLSGHRRLGLGPVRNTVLEVRFATADGRVVKGGGPTVKNVTGFDLPRVLVGSLGTLGVLGQVTLRARARARAVRWLSTAGAPEVVRERCATATCIAWDGRSTHVRAEGHPADVDDDAARAGLAHAGPPAWPAGAHRGRISVRPNALSRLAAALDATGVRWLAEVGVGTVHVAAGDADALAGARAAAHDAGGWLLREAGAPGLDGFGVPLPNLGIMRRLKAAFDPDGKLAPGRLPL